MKKAIVILLTLLVAGTANADPFHGHHHHHGPVYVTNDWVGPALVTGVLGFAIGRSTAPQQTQPVIVQQPPQTYPGPVAYPNQYPVYVERQYCGPWTETQNPDGTSSRTRTCN